MRAPAVFLVKNGIGFGHIRRALLIAEALAARDRLTPVVVSQAGSLAPFRHRRVRVVNFPLLHRVPSAVAEDTYHDMLDGLLRRLRPHVVVEDTYPDPRYGRLGSIADTPRLLVLRRMDGASLDQVRGTGALRRYDRVLVTQSESEFRREDHSGDTLAAAAGSGRFRFVGNLHHTATAEQVEAARMRFSPGGEPLVVVSAGAGGDQLGDGYGDRLFSAATAVAARLHDEGTPARFVLATGPYYAGRPITAPLNTTVRRYEPALPALLAAAHVAVLKPGNNVVSEALVGGAHLVLVPAPAFLEGLDGHAHRLVGDFGGRVTRPTADELEPAIRAALQQPPRARRATANAAGLDEVVEAIESAALQGQRLPQVPRRAAVLLLRAGDAPTGTAMGEALGVDLRGWSPLTAAEGPLAPVAVSEGGVPEASPQELVDRGARLLLHPQPDRLARWLRLAPPRPSLLTAPVHVLDPADGVPLIARRIAAVLAEGTATALLLDAPRTDPVAAIDLARDLAAWLRREHVDAAPPSTLLAERAARLLEARA